MVIFLLEEVKQGIYTSYIYYHFIGIYNELFPWKGDEPVLTSCNKSIKILHLPFAPTFNGRIYPQ